MNKNYIKEMWEKLTGETFSSEFFFNTIQFDGGLDTSDICEETVVSLLDEEMNHDIDDVVFSFSELLAYYSVMETHGIKFQPKQIVAWIFSAFVISEEIRKKNTDWELQFEQLINGFIEVKKYIDVKDSIYILSNIFCETKNKE